MKMAFRNIHIGLFGSLLMLTSCGNTEREEKNKPNIIYILADDLGIGDVSCYGQKKFITPNIDKLAAEGMKFMQHYAGSTVCAPSRSSLLTGQHTGVTPIRGNKEHKPEGQAPMPAECLTIAEVLKEAGYVTGAFGKWGLGYPGSEGDPNNQGFDEFYGYNCQRQAHHYYPWHLYHNQEKVVLEGNAGTNSGEYVPLLLQEKVLEFIENNKDTSFFLFVPTPLPHAELFAPESYLERFRGKYDPEVSYEGVDDPGHRGYRMGAYGSQPEAHAAFAAMVSLLDDQVGEIMDKLKELGLDDNTIIMFSSDNGPHKEGGADPDYFNSNSIYKGYKRDLYEGGIREPMIAYWKGRIKPGSTTDHVSAFWDVLPTVADIANVEYNSDVNGVSFLPTLLGTEDQKKHEYLYWEFHEGGGKQAVLLDGKWKGIRLDVKENPEGEIMLFNLDDDPGEENDIAADHPDIADRIAEIMVSARVPSPNFNFGHKTVIE